VLRDEGLGEELVPWEDEVLESLHRTPKGNKLNIAIHALNDAPAYKYE
jgi:hypothetical protein